MLVLTRRVGETILVGDSVELRLIEATEQRLRLTIRLLKAEAPILKVTLTTNQRVEIGDHITVIAVVCSGDHTRIGIAAPPDVSIMRGEMRPSDTNIETDGPGRGVRHGQEA